jgi:hypothetical protein
VRLLPPRGRADFSVRVSYLDRDAAARMGTLISSLR